MDKKGASIGIIVGKAKDEMGGEDKGYMNEYEGEGMGSSMCVYDKDLPALKEKEEGDMCYMKVSATVDKKEGGMTYLKIDKIEVDKEYASDKKEMSNEENSDEYGG